MKSLEERIKKLNNNKVLIKEEKSEDSYKAKLKLIRLKYSSLIGDIIDQHFPEIKEEETRNIKILYERECILFLRKNFSENIYSLKIVEGTAIVTNIINNKEWSNVYHCEKDATGYYLTLGQLQLLMTGSSAGVIGVDTKFLTKETMTNLHLLTFGEGYVSFGA